MATMYGEISIMTAFGATTAAEKMVAEAMSLEARAEGLYCQADVIRNRYIDKTLQEMGIEYGDRITIRFTDGKCEAIAVRSDRACLVYHRFTTKGKKYKEKDYMSWVNIEHMIAPIKS